MPNEKHNYDSEEFYQKIIDSAERQMSENHIIWDKVVAADLGLHITAFSAMKNGIYPPWNKEENERRSKRIKEILTRARASVEPEVWKMVLELGLGKVQSQDITFEKIGGEVQDSQRITVHKLPPSLAAISLWLRHHSENFRKIENGMIDVEDTEVSAEIDHGIEVQNWIKKELASD